jgi:hypothetical protein
MELETDAPEKLIERLRGLDLKALPSDALYDLIQEVHAMIDGVDQPRVAPLDLDQRVRLLRIWHVLILLWNQINPEAMAEVVTPDVQVAEPEQPQPVEEAAQEIVTEIAAIGVRELGEEANEAVERHVLEPELVTVEHHPHEPIEPAEVKDSPKASGSLEIAGPEHAQGISLDSQRIRLRLIKEGTLMQRVLPPGTVVLVYQLDADHLIEQGIAEILPADPLNDRAIPVETIES